MLKRMKYLPPKYILERIIYKSDERGLSDKCIQRLLGIRSSLNFESTYKSGKYTEKSQTKAENVPELCVAIDK